MALLSFLFLTLCFITTTSTYFDCRTKRCTGESMICQNNEDCTVDCAFDSGDSDNNNDEACNDAAVQCPTDAQCEVICHGSESCERMTLHAEDSTNLTVSCGSFRESCEEIDIYCPTAAGCAIDVDNSGRIGHKRMEIFAVNGFNTVAFSALVTLQSHITLRCGSQYEHACNLSLTAPFDTCSSGDSICEKTVTTDPSSQPSNNPVLFPSASPITMNPSSAPSEPSQDPSASPSKYPTVTPLKESTALPSSGPIAASTINENENEGEQEDELGEDTETTNYQISIDINACNNTQSCDMSTKAITSLLDAVEVATIDAADAVVVVKIIRYEVADNEVQIRLSVTQDAYDNVLEGDVIREHIEAEIKERNLKEFGDVEVEREHNDSNDEDEDDDPFKIIQMVYTPLGIGVMAGLVVFVVVCAFVCLCRRTRKLEKHLTEMHVSETLGTNTDTHTNTDAGTHTTEGNDKVVCDDESQDEEVYEPGGTNTNSSHAISHEIRGALRVHNDDESQSERDEELYCKKGENDAEGAAATAGGATAGGEQTKGDIETPKNESVDSDDVRECGQCHNVAKGKMDDNDGVFYCSACWNNDD